MSSTKMLRRIALGAAVASAAFATATWSQPQQQQATWSMEAPLPAGRSEMRAALVNGKIYMIGGGWTEMKDGKEVENYTTGFATEYDPATDRWRELTKAPEGLTHQALAVVNGKIYVAGGFAGSRHTLPSAGFYAYDPKTDKWQTLAPLSAKRGSVALAQVNGIIHAIGGRVGG
jgi:N-acetylneuraminic acid mutarotase